MSIASYHGSKVLLMEAKNHYSMDEIRQRRASEMYSKKELEKWSIPDLQKFYGLSRSYIFAEIASIPSDIKLLIEKRGVSRGN